jgi:chromosome segregation ATPase
MPDREDEQAKLAEQRVKELGYVNIKAIEDFQGCSVEVILEIAALNSGQKN